MSILYLLLYDHYEMNSERQQSSDDFPAWQAKTRSLALGDYDIKTVSEKALRDLFEAGWTPQQAALRLAEWSSAREVATNGRHG